MSLCQCGCGMPAPIARITDNKRGVKAGQSARFIPGHNQKARYAPGHYTVRYVPSHPKAPRSSGCVPEHVLVAERAFGRILLTGAEVHHVDGDSSNNSASNLVICQDKAYHKLLHVRARVVRAGGDPDTQSICSRCKTLKGFDEFGKASGRKHSGRQTACRSCMSLYRSERTARDRAKREKGAAA